jgi:hypothetical protein
MPGARGLGRTLRNALCRNLCAEAIDRSSHTVIYPEYKLVPFIMIKDSFARPLIMQTFAAAGASPRVRFNSATSTTSGHWCTKVWGIPRFPKAWAGPPCTGMMASSQFRSVTMWPGTKLSSPASGRPASLRGPMLSGRDFCLRQSVVSE